MTDTDEYLEAVREIGRQATRLRIVCLQFPRTTSLLHIAYDRNWTPAPVGVTEPLEKLKKIR